MLTNSKTRPDTVTLESGLVVPSNSVSPDSPFIRRRRYSDLYLGGLDVLAQLTGARMDVQGFQGAPIVDPPVAALGTLSSSSIEDMWPGITWTPIFANDCRAGKVYHVRMFGTCSLTGGTGIITPQWGPAGTTLGVSLTQGTVTVTATGMYLAFDLLVQSVGAAGANSKVIGGGFWTCGGGVSSGTANPNLITFGGTQASVDTTINGNVTIRKTLSATNSFIVQNVFIYSGR
jgi:hypothetical protein